MSWPKRMRHLRTRRTRARLLRQEWLHGFKVGHSKDLIRLKNRREAIGEALSLPDSSLLIRDEEGEDRALFALYTAYAVFVKIAAHEALQGVSAEIAARAPTQDVREMLRDIESGRLFREIGLHNVLEGDVPLYPVVLGRRLAPFQAPWKDLRMTPLPWDGTSAGLMDARTLAARPHHEAYLFENRENISRETQRDDQRLVSAQWFYPTRFGPCQIYPWKVLVRTNIRWAAAVASDALLPWASEIGGLARRMIIPGLKASFMAERRRGPCGVGAPIREDEAHYLAAVLNATPPSDPDGGNQLPP